MRHFYRQALSHCAQFCALAKHQDRGPCVPGFGSWVLGFGFGVLNWNATDLLKSPQPPQPPQQGAERVV